VIPFNRPYLTGKEFTHIQEAVAACQLAGNGRFTKLCQDWLERRIGAPRVLLTQSCTAALEMAALLLDIEPGDEVIMPSFTFVSSANAFVLRGARPVFVDIRADTLNLDERLVEAAITARTKAILVMHYAGVACEMDALLDVAHRRGLVIVEDAAHALMSGYKGRPLGGFGHLATFSFHETKNVISGEGGALVINDPRFAERAEIIWEKGTASIASPVAVWTNTRGWISVRRSCRANSPRRSLWAQLRRPSITARRLEVWNRYRGAFDRIEALGLRMPVIRRRAAQRPPVLSAAAVARAPARHLMSTQCPRRERGVSLRPAALVTSGRAVWPACGSMSVTDDCSAVSFDCRCGSVCPRRRRRWLSISCGDRWWRSAANQRIFEHRHPPRRPARSRCRCRA
jgi:dTDP-4-amino-4,6-dideoxygalactose transaminase